MPKKLRFRYGPPAGPALFQCDLSCIRCEGNTRAGAQCRRSTCAHLPYCPQHLRSELGLEVRNSLVSGKGLFAATGRPPNVHRIVFNPANDSRWIASLEGDPMTPAALEARYGGRANYPAPYTVEINEHLVHDGACARSAGQYANTAVRPTNARRIHAGACNARIRLRRTDMFGHVHAGMDVPWLCATKPIHEGDEILVEYGNDYLLGRTFADLHPHSTSR